MRPVGLLLALAVVLSSAQKHGTDPQNQADRRSCANLTLVLDNWKFAIMTQLRDLLLNDHNAVLPDYGRIRPLSEALAELYGEFGALKRRLAGLSEGFQAVEAFVDSVRSGGGRGGGARGSEVSQSGGGGASWSGGS
ncbi:uncharacterized protein ACNS7B_021829 [Menidia menidia]